MGAATDQLTDEDVKAQIAKAVADAVEPLTQKVSDLEAERDGLQAQLEDRDTSDAVKKAVADAIEPLSTRIGQLETEIAEATAAKDAAETEVTALKDWFGGLATEQAIKDRRVERIEAVKETGVYEDKDFDETVEANKDRIDKWASMDDAVFDALIDGWKSAGPRKKDEGNGKELPSNRSAMTDALTEGADTTKGGGKSGLGNFFHSTIPGMAAAKADS